MLRRAFQHRRWRGLACAVIEVVPHGNGFAWRMICALGRILAYSTETFPCITSAADAAKAYRREFWALADRIDHRMGACI